MAAEDEPLEDSPTNLLEVTLERAREQYIEEHDEEPPEEFMEDARELILRRLAKHERDEHREVYDALADE